jgi:hypothetical protein
LGDPVRAHLLLSQDHNIIEFTNNSCQDSKIVKRE